VPYFTLSRHLHVMTSLGNFVESWRYMKIGNQHLSSLSGSSTIKMTKMSLNWKDYGTASENVVNAVINYMQYVINDYLKVNNDTYESHKSNSKIIKSNSTLTIPSGNYGTNQTVITLPLPKRGDRDKLNYLNKCCGRNSQRPGRTENIGDQM
jgi:hypothetical protein